MVLLALFCYLKIILSIFVQVLFASILFSKVMWSDSAFVNACVYMYIIEAMLHGRTGNVSAINSLLLAICCSTTV